MPRRAAWPGGSDVKRTVSPMRRLIVNADDFGRSPGVNRGVVEAVDAGVVTSASLMVRWPAAEPAARLARDRRGLSLGLHVDLAEWTFRDRQWRASYQVADPDDPVAARAELARQLGAFERLVGRPPTHLDSHQHVHRGEAVRRSMVEVADRLGVPLRGATPRVAYCGSFYGQSGKGDPYPQGITLPALLAILDGLGEGTTELACHPGADGLCDLDSTYLSERAAERRVLCDPTVRDAIAARGIELCSFADVPPARSEPPTR